MKFVRRNPISIFLLLIFVGGGYLLISQISSDSKQAEKEGHHAEEGDSTEMSQAVADASGIKTDTAQGAIVRQTITLTGLISLNQNTTAQVKARFPGIVRDVRKGQGETVNAGDVLAMVESNDSLQTYPVKSPITGSIIIRNTNIGDVAADAPLFTIANISNVWGEFHIFPRDIDRIKKGQMVRITSFEGQHNSTAPIDIVLPVAEASSQTIIARVMLPNPDGVWRAGMTVKGDVIINEQQVPLAVRTSAIQRMENKVVVFIKEDDHYIARPIETGLSDSEWTEVRDGLKENETYVSENSFIIKADIGKSNAEHEH
ncbi:MAG: efflux RND transporter periplasmic adaptor subunit [Alphaproteobacteria bacterium]